uniref:Uncharacterized protein n=1 Tax=Malurus cyaneus samueli TaxID=2593467 RepID=A0A8C5THQ1_9PASS
MAGGRRGPNRSSYCRTPLCEPGAAGASAHTRGLLGHRSALTDQVRSWSGSGTGLSSPPWPLRPCCSSSSATSSRCLRALHQHLQDVWWYPPSHPPSHTSLVTWPESPCRLHLGCP